MSDEQMDDIFRELQDDLASVRPSPEFAAKVRQQVAAQPQGTWFGVWQIATAASVLTIAVLAFVFWRSQVEHVEAPAPRDVIAQTPPTPSPSVASSTAETPTMPEQKNRATTRRTTVTQQMARVQHGEPEVLVPSDQRTALISLLASMRTRGAEVPPEATAVVDSEGRLPAPAAITVPAISIQPLSPPVPGGGSRER